MPAPRESGLSAFVGAFGNSFAATHNDRIQQRLAVKARQDASMADILIKSGMDEPELWENENFKKAATSVLGNQNAKAMAEVAMQFAQSPVGLLKKALGAESLTTPVSGEAEGPGTGPSVPFNELDQTQQTAVARARLADRSPTELGIGFKPSVGALQADTQKLNVRDATLGFKEREAVRQQANTDREFELKQKAETRRLTTLLKDVKMGELELRQTPVGERAVRKFFDPESGITYVAPIGGLKQGSSPAETVKSMRATNDGLRLTGEISTLIRTNPADFAELFTPFAGKSLNQLEKNLGSLTDPQRRMVLKILNLRNTRVNVLGGQALTATEHQLYNEVLPSDFNTTARLAAIALEETERSLLSLGAISEAAAEQNRQAAVRTRVTTPEQRAQYKRLRAASRHSFRDLKQVPLLPGEVLFDGNASTLMQGRTGAAATPPAAGGGQDDGSAALDAAFLQ